MIGEKPCMRAHWMARWRRENGEDGPWPVCVLTGGDAPYWPTLVPPPRINAAWPAYAVVPPSSQGGVRRAELEESS